MTTPGMKLNMAASGNKFSGVLKRSLSDTADALLFTGENHRSTILKGLFFALYEDGKYPDISLKIGPERTLRAHRAVLASFSPYFEALLGDNWKEGNKEEIEILGFDEGAFSDLIEFAYTGKINIDKDNALTLLEAANYLGIQTVKESCGNFLEQVVDAKSCLGILQLADMFAMDELSSVVKRYALRYFTDVCKEDEFLCLPVDLLTDLLSEERLCVVVEDVVPCVEEREKTVLESVLQYVEHDVENRKTHLAQLLGLVRLPTLSAEYLAEVSRNKLLEESEFQDILERAKNFKLHPPKKGTSVVICATPTTFARIIYSSYFNRYQVPPSVEEREKMVEESVLQYVEHDVENGKTHLAHLLDLVRLPTLSVEYLAEVSPNKLSVPVLVKVLEKVKKFKLNPPEKDTPDEKWATPRKFTEHVFMWGYCYAYRDQVQTKNIELCIDEMFEDLKNGCYVTGMELWIRKWDGQDVVGGLKVYYNNGKATVFGQDCGGTYAETAWDDHVHHEFHLEENERIVKAEVQRGQMIDRLTFYTNKKDKEGKRKRYGPYGGNGVTLSAESVPESFGYLCGVSGAVVKSQGEAGITHLRFVWRLYVLPGEHVSFKQCDSVAQAPEGEIYYDSEEILVFKNGADRYLTVTHDFSSSKYHLLL